MMLVLLLYVEKTINAHLDHLQCTKQDPGAKRIMGSTRIFFLIGFFTLCIQLPLFCHAIGVPPPDKVKSGVCPRIDAICHGGTVGNQCSGDDHCPGALKCCPGPCGKACFVPKGVKAGACPLQILGCRIFPVDACKKDQDCTGKNRCCPGFCGKECRTPEQDKPKTCPGEVFKCPTLGDYECNNDSGCKGAKKCCFSKCALRCVDPR